ncbi:MAG TPA: 3D domain-containing protein, partial [Clostridiales bacterium]|nr:3D domain-containing protein [Clostridiales bacterium]
LQDGIPTNALKVIKGSSTAYTAPSGAKCSTGVTARSGYVAVDPKKIPYGSELYIVSADGKKVYGYAIAADTGGFVHNSNTVVDLYMNSNAQCTQWGRRNVVIYVLSWGTWGK